MSQYCFIKVFQNLNFVSIYSIVTLKTYFNGCKELNFNLHSIYFQHTNPTGNDATQTQHDLNRIGIESLNNQGQIECNHWQCLMIGSDTRNVFGI